VLRLGELPAALTAAPSRVLNMGRYATFSPFFGCSCRWLVSLACRSRIGMLLGLDSSDFGTNDLKHAVVIARFDFSASTLAGRNKGAKKKTRNTAPEWRLDFSLCSSSRFFSPERAAGCPGLRS